MNRQEFETLFKQEKNYWWFIGQRYLASRILKGRRGLKILDVGCGAGINMLMLQKYGDVEGCDISDEAVKFCKKRGLSIKKSDVLNLKYKDNSFDLVTVFGVFYHKGVRDDLSGMKEIYRVLKPNGMFFIFEPAMKCLFSNHDLAFQGIRRYSVAELRGKLKKAGFKVERVSYVNFLLFPLLFVKRKLEFLGGKKAKSEVGEINPLVNKFLTKMYLFELRMLKYISYPFGINVFGVGKKKL